jgi:hypothetical protein
MKPAAVTAIGIVAPVPYMKHRDRTLQRPEMLINIKQL